jgi:hypothetical protein
MTDSDITPTSVVLKRDSRGRVRSTLAQRRALLEAFARSGLSGPAFALVAGINYQTFATWRQEQRKPAAAITAAPAVLPLDAQARPPRFVEVTRQETPCSSLTRTTLCVDMPGGASFMITDAAQTTLAAQLIKALSSSSPC